MDSKRAWWVAFGAFLAITINAGIGFFVTPVMIERIMTDMSWSLTEISLGFTVWGLSAALFSPFCGQWIDRFGSRRMMLLGTGFAVLITCLLSQITSLWQFYILMFLAPFGVMSNTYIPAAAVVARWFMRHRGIATGLVMFGIGVGGTLLPLMTNQVLKFVEWRETYLLMALLQATALIPIALWIRNPEKPETTDPTSDDSTLDLPSTNADLSLVEALKTRSFWGLSIGDAITGAVFTIFNVHLVYYLTKDFGSDDTATQVYSALQFCIGFGTLIFGPLADRFMLRKVMVFCYLLPALATGMLLPGGILWLAFLFAFLAGFPGGGRNALFPVALYSSFGETHMGAIYGFSNSFFMIGTAIGPVLAGVLYDSTGDTRIVYSCAIAALVVSTILVSIIKDERRPASA
jgi:OFA family oxalate/formate antiporter-like MFS transporter